MLDDVVVTERREHVLVARLNRPDARNAMNGAVVGALGAAAVEAETDADIRVLVVTGTGDKAFCAGMDLRDFASGEHAPIDPEHLEATRRLVRGDVRVPVVGAANASALAGGFELLLGCDIVVASRDAKFGLPEVKRGLFAAGNGTQIGMRLPLAVALELTLTGDSIDAARAHDLGLVNQVVSPDEVLDVALAFAERIAANGPLAIMATKELVRLWPINFDQAQRRKAELQEFVFSSDDAKEGATAFVERRAPVWKGH
jgi:enoyl-CoA hydratase